MISMKNMKRANVLRNESHRELRKPVTIVATIGVVALLGAIQGCGAPDLSSSSRSNSFDQGLSGNYSGANGSGSRQNGGLAPRGRGTYARFETSFEIRDLQGNPFDVSENDVQVSFQTPDNRSVRVPAFYDGNKLWRVRFTADAPGRYSLGRIQNNGHDIQPERIERKDFDASGSPQAGFVRHDTKDKQRFVFDSGSNYYPLGHNVAWSTPKVDESATKRSAVMEQKSAPPDVNPNVKQDPLNLKPIFPTSPTSPTSTASSGASGTTNYAADYSAIFDKMSQSGENWSRVWMTAWDGKSLFWSQKNKLPVGQFDLEAARRMDSIIDAAEKNSIYLQVALFHHGQFSTKTDANWDKNPLNSKNGGFLSTPDEFFSNSRAINLTKSMARYSVARWGYSPNIMAWELFNEVENTDAATHKHLDEIAQWHNGIASFIRTQDPNKHLITSSSGTDAATFGRELDFYQLHRYAADAYASAADVDVRKSDRPVFIGEFGPDNEDINKSDFLHTSLWCGLASEAGAACQSWDSAVIDKSDLYSQYRPVSDFIRQSGFISKKNMTTGPITVDSGTKSDLILNPGSNWGVTSPSELNVLSNGWVSGLGGTSKYLAAASAGTPTSSSLSLKTDWTQAGNFKVTIDKAAPSGAHVTLAIDGVTVGEKDIPGAGGSKTILESKVPQGNHTIKLANTGSGWVILKNLTFENYASSVGAVGKSSKEYGIAYLYKRDSSKKGDVTAKISVPTIQTGEYKITWWDTVAGKTVAENVVTADASGLTAESPKFENDIACYFSKSNQKSQKSQDKKDKGAAIKTK